MVTQTEVKQALRKLGGSGTSKEIAEQIEKDSVYMFQYKQANTLTSIVSSTLDRCRKWGEVKPELRTIGWTGKPQRNMITWVLVE